MAITIALTTNYSYARKSDDISVAVKVLLEVI